MDSTVVLFQKAAVMAICMTHYAAFWNETVVFSRKLGVELGLGFSRPESNHMTSIICGLNHFFFVLQNCQTFQAFDYYIYVDVYLDIGYKKNSVF